MGSFVILRVHQFILKWECRKVDSWPGDTDLWTGITKSDHSKRETGYEYDDYNVMMDGGEWTIWIMLFRYYYVDTV